MGQYSSAWVAAMISVQQQIKKMPQSGVGSMQGSKERTHTRGGRTHNVTQRTDTHIFKGGGTHPQCNPTNGHTNIFWTN